MNHYFYNAALSWNDRTSGSNFTTSVSEAALLFSSLTVMLGDGNANNGGGTASTRSNGFTFNGNITSTAAPGTFGALNTRVANIGFGNGGQRHLEGLNIAFADGHVKWYKSAGENESAIIYQANSTFTVSQQNPTFNATQQ